MAEILMDLRDILRGPAVLGMVILLRGTRVAETRVTGIPIPMRLLKTMQSRESA
jgi:hypothetical protein